MVLRSHGSHRNGEKAQNLVLRAGDIILVIDEIHTMVGMGAVSRGGAAGSGLDVANLLKPALSRGQLQVSTAPHCTSHCTLHVTLHKGAVAGSTPPTACSAVLGEYRRAFVAHASVLMRRVCGGKPKA